MFTISAEHRRDGAVLLAYFILALFVTYPLILQFGTHVAGDGSDDPALAWNLWWVRYAILDLGRSPIYTNYLFYPIGLNLAFYTLTYLNAFLSIPIQFAFGLIPAANVNLILSFALSGFGAYLLVKYLLRHEGTFELSPDNGIAVTLSEAKGLWLTSPRDSSPRKGRSAQNDTVPFEKSWRDESASFAAFAAGLLYAFSSNKFLYASLGQFNIASSQWIPFYVLFLIKCFPVHPRSHTPTPLHSHTSTPTLLHSFLLGLFLLFQALSEFIFASFLIIFTVAYLIYWLVANRSRNSKFKIRNSELEITNYGLRITNLAVALATFFLPMLPILAAMLSDTLAEGDFIQSGLGFSNVFSADLLGFFIPSHLHPIFGGLESQFNFSYINFVYLGYVALALAFIALLRVRRARIWSVWFALVFLLTLGPTLRINGAEFNLPLLPFNALLEIPFIKGNRYPSRWSVLLALFLAVLVGYGFAWVMKNVKRSNPANPSRDLLGVRTFERFLLPSALCLLLLFEHLSLPLPTSDLRVPDVYASIGREPGDFAVLELPLAWRNGFRVTGSYRADSQALIDRGFMLAQWYQSAQHHPILNGNTSRNPELKFQYFAETPVIDSLIAIQEGHSIDEATRARDKQLAPRLLQLLNVRYVIWHAPYEETNRDVATRTRAYVEDIFPVSKTSETYENGQGLVVYRVNDLSSGDSLTVKPDDPLARVYFAEGWGAIDPNMPVVWAVRRQAKIFLPWDSVPQPARLSLRFLNPLAGQRVQLNLNGESLGVVVPNLGEGEYTLDVPEAALRRGINELLLSFAAEMPAPDPLPPGSDIGGVPKSLAIGRTGVNSPVSIVVRSAGEEQGDFGHIYVNGVDQSPNGRGYNLVVIDAQSGQVEARANFDTCACDAGIADPGANSLALARFIAQIPAGKIVAVAVRDEASLHLAQEAVDALRSIGTQEDLRGKFRWSHALIGVKGAAAGSALEATSETRVSQLIVGISATEPNIAAALEEITLQPQQ